MFLLHRKPVKGVGCLLPLTLLLLSAPNFEVPQSLAATGAAASHPSSTHKLVLASPKLLPHNSPIGFLTSRLKLPSSWKPNPHSFAAEKPNLPIRILAVSCVIQRNLIACPWKLSYSFYCVSCLPFLSQSPSQPSVMDHRSANSDNEPFFSVLNSAALSPSPSTSNFESNYLQNSIRIGDDSDFDFGTDDVLPSYDFQPIRRGGGTNSSNGLNNSTEERMEEGSSTATRHRQAASSYSGYGVGSTVYKTGEPSTFGPSTSRREIDMDSYHSAVVSVVERTMKKYADNLLRVLEGMSVRLSQLESSTQGLEHSLAELKISVANTHGEVDGRLRMLNNHLVEVQRAVQILRDKQEIAEAHAELVKLQVAKTEGPRKKSSNISTAGDKPQAKHAEANEQLQVPTQSQRQQQLPCLPAPQQPETVVQTESPVQANMQPTTPASYNMQLQQYIPQHAHMQQSQPQQLQMSSQPPMLLSLPSQAQLQLSLPKPTQIQEPVPQQGHISQPVPQQIQAPHAIPEQLQASQTIPQHMPVPQPLSDAFHIQLPNTHVQQPMAAQSSFQAQPLQQARLPLPSMQVQPIQQPQPASQVQSQQTPLVHSQMQQTQMQPPSQGPFQQYTHQSDSQSYFPLSHSSPVQGPSAPSGYGVEPPTYSPANFGFPPHLVSQSPLLPSQRAQLGTQTYDPSLQRNSAPSSSLPLPSSHPVYDTQAVLPSSGLNSHRVSQPLTPFPHGYHNLPSAQPVSGGPSASGIDQPANRVTIDNIVEKVAAMGFSREQVRSAVRILTEGGQSVDLNVVLDKLMNGGTEEQPQRGWYGR